MRSKVGDVKNCQTRVNVMRGGLGVTTWQLFMGPTAFAYLASGAPGRDQSSHLSIGSLDGGNQRVGVGGNVDERIPHLRWFAFDVLGIVVDEYVPLPMRGAANFATGTPVPKAYEEAIKFIVVIPPDHDQVTELSRRPVGVALAEQSHSSGSQAAM